MEADHGDALQLAIDHTVESFKGSKDFFLINNKAYLRGYQELRQRFIKNFPEAKEMVLAWKLSDAEHQECIAELKAATEERAKLRAEAEAASTDGETETAADGEECDNHDDAAS